jgi:hypothetical protein
MKLYEALTAIKFHYSNFKNDPRPLVKVLDTEYPGREGQKTYGQRKDVLGWNLNYTNRKYAIKAIDEIDDFASLLSADNQEKYERVRIFFPEQAEFLRRYNKEHIKGLRVKKEDGLWHQTSFNELKNQ